MRTLIKILAVLLACLPLGGDVVVIGRGVPAGGGGGGGPFTFVKSAGAEETGSDANITVQLTTVTAGNLIVIFVKHEEAPTSISVSDGTTTFTGATKVNHSNNDLSTQFFYLPTSVASGTVTYTATFGAVKTFKSIVAYEFDPTGTATFDTEPSGGGAFGTGGTLSSGNMTTTVAAGLVLGGYGNFSSQSLTTLAINGVAAAGMRGGDNTSAEPQDTTCAWYRIPTATFTGAATASGPSAAWTMHAIAFK